MSSAIKILQPKTAALHILVPLLAILGFSALAYLVHRDLTLPLDEFLLTAVNGWSTPFWKSFFVVMTEFGGVVAMTVIGIGFALLFASRKQWKRATIIAGALGGIGVLTVTLKLLFERPRPDLWEQLVVETSFSFPSGHAMASMGLGLLLAYLVWRTGWAMSSKVAVWVALAVYVIIIGLSRLYLGVHYPSDILAGWLISAAWVATIIPVINRYVRV